MTEWFYRWTWRRAGGDRKVSNWAMAMDNDDSANGERPRDKPSESVRGEPITIVEAIARSGRGVTTVTGACASACTVRLRLMKG